MQRKFDEAKKDKCGEHNEELVMFCMDCMELVCMKCIAGSHGRFVFLLFFYSPTRLAPEHEHIHFGAFWGYPRSYVGGCSCSGLLPTALSSSDICFVPSLELPLLFVFLCT